MVREPFYTPSVETMAQEDAKHIFLVINVYYGLIISLFVEAQQEGWDLPDAHERIKGLAKVLLNELPEQVCSLFIPQSGRIVVREGREEIPTEDLTIWTMDQVAEYSLDLASRALTSDK